MDLLCYFVAMFFRDLPGHEAIKNKLRQSVHDSRISHAQLFAGPEGCGSLPMALAYVQFISCTNRLPDDSCGQCESCKKMSKLAHPDIHFSLPVNQPGDSKATSAAFVPAFRQLFLKHPYLGLDEWIEAIDVVNKQVIINTHEAEEIVRMLGFKSFESEYKFLILWLPEKMNDSAANKLLKSFEEPPEKTLIILVSHDPASVLPTILSRTQLTRFYALSDAEIREALLQRYNVEEAVARKITPLSNGNVSKAIRLASEMEEYSRKQESFRNWMLNCRAKNITALLDETDTFSKLGREGQKRYLEFALHMVRSSLVMSFEPSVAYVTDQEAAFLDKFKTVMKPDKIEPVFELINQSIGFIERNANPKLMFFDLSLQLSKHLKG